MLDTMTEADKAQVKEILLAEKQAGNDNPMLPMNVDLDGDGIADAIGLNENGELVVIPGVAIEETVYESDGDDQEAE